MTGLKVIDGKSYQKCGVVMLPSEKAALYLDLGILRDIRNTQHIPVGTQIPQHLYFTSDEVLKTDEWCYHKASKEIVRYPKSGFPENHAKKVVASTDKSLGLPEPSKEFIEAYVKAYNEGKAITNVLVEYLDTWTKQLREVYPESKELYHPTLMVKSDNTITIRKTKESWSREEVESLFTKFYKEVDVDLSGESFKNWIEQNL
jgi:hypothetical protein